MLAHRVSFDVGMRNLQGIVQRAFAVAKAPESSPFLGMPRPMAVSLNRQPRLDPSEKWPVNPELDSRLRDSIRHAIRNVRGMVLATGNQFDRFKALRRHLFSKMLYSPKSRTWRLQSAALTDLAVLSKWISFSGRDYLDEAVRAGRGTILAGCQFGAPRLLPLIVAKHGYEILVILAMHGYRANSVPLPPGMQVLSLHEEFLPKVVLTAQRLLKKGGMVYIVGDGYMGEHKLGMPMLGRRMEFAPGFAELGVNTGATILPVWSSYDENGYAHLNVHPPLDPGSDQKPKSERIESLVRQFAAHLEQLWINDPGNIEPVHVKKHFTLPRFDETLPVD